MSEHVIHQLWPRRYNTTLTYFILVGPNRDLLLMK